VIDWVKSVGNMQGVCIRLAFMGKFVGNGGWKDIRICVSSKLRIKKKVMATYVLALSRRSILRRRLIMYIPQVLINNLRLRHLLVPQRLNNHPQLFHLPPEITILR